MKKSKIVTQMLIVGLLMVFSVSSLVSARGVNQEIAQNYCPVVEGEVYELSEEQREDLIFMYQEEKMARDLYASFAEKWDARTFENISRSENRHMSAIARLIDKYEIEVAELEAGEFENEELAELYQDLSQKGLSSYEAALEVGRAVEIKDIEDLERKAARATPDVEAVFMNLRQGSENHLSAFERQLARDITDNRGSNSNRGQTSKRRQGARS